MDHLESFIADCDRRTELAKKRLAETQEEISAEVAAKVSVKRFLNTDIVTLMYYIHTITICFVKDISDVSCAVLQAEKVHELNEEIGKLLAKAEQLGAEGNVDEAQKVLQEVEKVRTRKKDAEVRKEYLGGASSLSKVLCFTYMKSFIF